MLDIFGDLMKQYKSEINYTRLVADLSSTKDIHSCWRSKIGKQKINGETWSIYSEASPNILGKSHASLDLSYKSHEKFIHVEIHVFSGVGQDFMIDNAIEKMPGNSMEPIDYKVIQSNEKTIAFAREAIPRENGYSQIFLIQSNIMVHAHAFGYDQDVKDFAYQIMDIVFDAKNKQYNSPVFTLKLSNDQPRVGEEITISVASNQKVDHEIKLNFRDYIDDVDPTTTRTEAKIKFLKAGKYSMSLIAMDKDTLYTETLSVEVDVSSDNK